MRCPRGSSHNIFGGQLFGQAHESIDFAIRLSRHFGAGLLDERNVLLGAFGEDFVVARLNGGSVDEFATDGDRAGTGAEEVGGGVEIDASGGVHLNVGRGL